MYRLLVLALSGMVCWGTATACSGGGGIPASDTPNTTLGDNGTVIPGGNNGSGNPGGSTLLSDGSKLLSNGVVIKVDGTAVYPDGTVALKDGSFQLPNGDVINPDGTPFVPVDSSILGAPSKPQIGGVNATLTYDAGTTQTFTCAPHVGETCTWSADVPDEKGNITKENGTDKTFTLHFAQGGKYKLVLTLSNAVGGTDSDPVTLTAIATPKGVITGVTAGRSYPNAALKVSAKDSQFVSKCDWSFLFGAKVITSIKAKPDDSSCPDESFMPNPTDFGPYLVGMIPYGPDGVAVNAPHPLAIGFNVRADSVMQMSPFPATVTAASLAFKSDDAYVATSDGLFHRGADGSWVQVILSESVGSLAARSSNDVFAGGDGAIWHYTADKGWTFAKDGGNIAAGVIGSLAIVDDKTIYAVDSQNNLIYSNDNSFSWHKSFQVMQYTSKLVAAEKSGIVYVAAGDPNDPNKFMLLVVDTINFAVTPYSTPDSTTAWKAITVASAGTVYVSNAAGSIFRYTGGKLELFAKMPANPNGGLTQALALWSNHGQIHALADDGGYYVAAVNAAVLPTSFATLIAGGTPVSVASIFGTVMTSIDSKGIPQIMVKNNAGGNSWSALLDPTIDGFQPVTAAAGMSSRSKGGSVFILNAQSKNAAGTITSTLQKIDGDGARSLISLNAPLLDVWPIAENDVMALFAGRLYRFQNQDPPAKQSGKVENVNMSAIYGLNSHEFFVTTADKIYKTTDGGTTYSKIADTTGDGSTFAAVWVAPDGTVFAGGTKLRIVTPDGAVTDPFVGGFGDPVHRISGTDSDHVYAVTSSKILMSAKDANGKPSWTVLSQGQNGAAELCKLGANTTLNDIAVIGPNDVYFSAGADGLIHWDGKKCSLSSPAQDIRFVSHAGVFTYFGSVGKADATRILKSGPMQ